uniref:Uncharacterized protein n=1 Tax=Arundo donax TaxID=35708 RepID=A0A0A8ZUP7_ARUDO
MPHFGTHISTKTGLALNCVIYSRQHTKTVILTTECHLFMATYRNDRTPTTG